MIMMLVDSFVCALAGLYLITVFQFIRAARQNLTEHYSDAIVSLHFTDHLYSSVVGLIGGTITFASSVFHFIAQNIIIKSDLILRQIEICEDLGVIVIFFSGIMFMIHMRKEETPGHPFYIREYGEDRKY